MIEGGWNFVYPAYAVTFLGLAALAVSIIWRARTWAKAARELDRKP